jgi:GR25 family glycosyltransferase involved in LPS biosynthesis
MIISFSNLQTCVISLKRDIEKRDSTTKYLKSCGINNISFFDAIERNPGRTGLAMSFKKILSKNIEKIHPILICEDDIIKNSQSNISSIEIPDDADALYLGITKHGYTPYINPYNDPYGASYSNHRDRSLHPSKIVAKKINDDLYRIYNMLSAHAIVMINPEYTKFLSNAIDIAILNGGHQDIVRASTMAYWNIYALDIPLFHQGSSHDSSTKIQLSKLGKSETTDRLEYL